jgi:uncharacterized protein with ATP-grasp and redox domains
MVSNDERIHEQVLRRVLEHISEMDMQQSPPAMGQTIHRLIREATGSPDPYREYKRKWNTFSLQLFPELKRRIEDAADPFDTAVRMAVAGNIIDFAARPRVNEAIVRRSISAALSTPWKDTAVETLYREVMRARRILYLTDNAGEIVFDRLLIERLPMENVTVAVKGSPVCNDATMEDAVEAGLKEPVNVIPNGSDAPGTMLKECSVQFKGEFARSDVVIAKGQANYETLSKCNHNVFFILMAKCPVIAREIGCKQENLMVFREFSQGTI